MKLTQMTKSLKEFKEFTAFTIDSNENVDAGLQSRLDEYGLVLSPTSKDGNCFFHAISMNIMAHLDSWNHCLTRIGISNTLEMECVSMKLRQAFVQEITGDHRDSYESFISGNVDYLTEANKFLQKGYYASSLGDIMPLAMATVLQTSFVIITVIITTTNPHNNLMYVTPLFGSIEGTVILVYNPTGSSHYDASLPYSSKVVGQTGNMAKSKSCSCGVNKKNLQSACAPTSIYTS